MFHIFISFWPARRTPKTPKGVPNETSTFHHHLIVCHDRLFNGIRVAGASLIIPSLNPHRADEKQIDNGALMALPSIDSDSQWVTEVFHQNAGSVTNVLPVFLMGALNVKRVENELHPHVW